MPSHRSNSAPSSSRHRPSASTSSRRPATIAELAERALDSPWEEGRDLKYYLRVAEKCRREGKDSAQNGDLESAFIHFARAATLVLEKLPSHRDYHTILTNAQRQNLGLNGQDILDNLSELKPILVERYERWAKAHPDGVDHGPATSSRQNSQDAGRVRQERTRLQEEEQRLIQLDQERRIKAEVDEWRRQREETLQRQEDEEKARVPRTNGIVADGRHYSASPSVSRPAPSSSQLTADLTFSRPPTQQNGNTFEYDRINAQLNLNSQHPHDEARKLEEELAKRRTEGHRMEEQAGIIKRQQEAEDAARAIRQTIVANSGPATQATAPGPSPMIYQPPSSSSSAPPPAYLTPQAPPVSYTPGSSAPSTIRAPRAMNSRPPSWMEGFTNNDAPLVMPLESPTRFDEDSTDSEVMVNPHKDWRRGGKHKQVDHRTPTRPPARSPSYPPPITTTSPPPTEGGRILYPQLMSQHQKTQGYVPSLHSMFIPSTNMHPPSSLLFDSDSSKTPNASYNGRPLYSSDLLPPPSVLAPYPIGMPQLSQPHQTALNPNFPGPARPAPPVPSQPQPQAPPPPPQISRSDSDRVVRAPSHRGDSPQELKTINLPRESLPRFLAIAKVNTALNRETCGLLLGKNKGHKYVVTTLLIPKQHSTSDTCTMDEEELVLQFTEERSLITLGWIHTHPSQSCFMSSVDLHTHSGFQRMLPESFAVVCAPKSNPNFGIFRLTDPPGLQTILGCTAKEAFHPHPDLPIYTDADKGHVQMKDSSLEIVDLR